MKTISPSHRQQARFSHAASRLVDHEPLFENPFSEATIIQLHAFFTTPGLHTISVRNPEEGCLVVATILGSLGGHYTAPAYVGATPCERTPDAFDLVAYITHALATQPDKPYDEHLATLFLEHWYFDIVWVEQTKHLEQEPWFSLFTSCLMDCSDSMPVILLTYEQE